MSDLKIDATTDDLVFEGGDLVLLQGADAIAQHIKIRLRMFEGEWFLDPTQGMPYYRQILQKTPDVSSVGAIFRQAILETPGVTSLDKFNILFNRQDRALSIEFRAQTDTGETLVFEEFTIDV